MSTFSSHETLAVSSSAVSLTAATYAGARAALITVESATIRYRVDGGTPTTSVGHVAAPGAVIELRSANELANFRAIRAYSTDAALSVSYGDNISMIQDNAASVAEIPAGAADSGNPVKVGGLASSTNPTAVVAGQRVNQAFDIYGRAQTAMATSTGTAGSDGINIVLFPFEAGSQNVSGQRSLSVAGSLFNGTSWDRARGNVAATGLASAARTASAQTPDQTNYNGRGAQIILDVTATPNNAETLQVTVEVKDSVSGKYVQIAAFTALVGSALGATPTTETYVYTLYPGAAETIAAAKHELQALPLGRTWRVNVLHSASGSWTYSVGLTQIV